MKEVEGRKDIRFKLWYNYRNREGGKAKILLEHKTGNIRKGLIILKKRINLKWLLVSGLGDGMDSEIETEKKKQIVEQRCPVYFHTQGIWGAIWYTSGILLAQWSEWWSVERLDYHHLGDNSSPVNGTLHNNNIKNREKQNNNSERKRVGNRKRNYRRIRKMPEEI